MSFALFNCLSLLKKEKNSNTRKLRKIFQAPAENLTYDLPSYSLDALTTEPLDF